MTYINTFIKLISNCNGKVFDDNILEKEYI